MLEVLAEVEFLHLDRSVEKCRYVNGCWPFIFYEELGQMAGCQLIMENEAFDGDKVDLILHFLDDSIHKSKIMEGCTFQLYNGQTHIANGVFKLVTNS